MIKQTIEDSCNQFLSDIELKNNMLDLLSYLKELKMKPSWYHTNSYKCDYKGKRVIMINMLVENQVLIRVLTTGSWHQGWYGDNGKLDNFLQNLPVEMKNEYMKSLIYCNNCTNCSPGYDIKLSGEVHKNLCAKSFAYCIGNPTSDQFEFVKKFVQARREYIINFAE